MRESRRKGMAALFSCSMDTVGVGPPVIGSGTTNSLLSTRTSTYSVRVTPAAPSPAAGGVGPAARLLEAGDDEMRLAVGAVPAHRHEAVLVVVHPHPRRSLLKCGRSAFVSGAISVAAPPAGIHTRSVMMSFGLISSFTMARCSRGATRATMRGRSANTRSHRRTPSASSASPACRRRPRTRQMSPPSSFQLTYAMYRPSGDQTGECSPSSPVVRRLGVPDGRSMIHRRSSAEKTRRFPLGDGGRRGSGGR